MKNNYIITSDGSFISDEEIFHYGIKGMKWGVRKDRQPGYKSTSIKALLAKRSNDKVDKSFKSWNENAKKRDNAIELGKKANAAKHAYEKNPRNKDAKSSYQKANKEYKKALSDNTTYRKGIIRQEVGKDSARKYLSEAKAVKKQLSADPSNKTLQKKYNQLMSKHDIERANARRATEVAANRSKKKASIKRAMTITMKTAAISSVSVAGAYAVNKYLSNHNVTLNGQSVRFSDQTISNIVEAASKVKKFMGYMY